MLKVETKAMPMRDYLESKLQTERSPAMAQEVQRKKDEKRDYNRRYDRIMLHLQGEEWINEAEKLERYHVVGEYIFKVTAYFLDEPEQESLKPATNKSGLRLQMSNQSMLKTRFGMTTSQFGNNLNEISVVYLMARSRTLECSFKKLLLKEDLRDYMYGSMQTTFSDSDPSYSANKKEHIFDILCDNLRIEDNTVVMTNDAKLKSNEILASYLTDFQKEINKQKILEGIQLLGVGGAFYTKTQIEHLNNISRKNGVEKQLVLNQEYMFSEHLHDIKIFKYNMSTEKEYREASNIYILETFEINNPEVIYT